MKNLLHFELFKLKKQKSLYICSGIILGLIILMGAIYYAISKLAGGELTGMPASAVSFTLSATGSSNFNLIVSIFIVLYFCGDFSQKTIKNIYSRGFSRTKVYFAKYIVCMAYIFAMYVICELFALAVGSAFFGFTPQGGNVGWLLLGQLLVCLAYASVVFAICAMIKKMGVAFAIVLVVPAVLSVILTIADVVIMVKSAEVAVAEKVTFSDFWLDGMLSTLSSTASSVKKIVLCSVLPVVYGAIFITMSFFINRKTEV